MVTVDKRCANGTVGYSVESGKSYAVKDPCVRPHVQGHILCDPCRVAAGGRPKARVESPRGPTSP